MLVEYSSLVNYGFVLLRCSCSIINSSSTTTTVAQMMIRWGTNLRLPHAQLCVFVLAGLIVFFWVALVTPRGQRSESRQLTTQSSRDDTVNAARRHETPKRRGDAADQLDNSGDKPAQRDAPSANTSQRERWFSTHFAPLPCRLFDDKHSRGLHIA